MTADTRAATEAFLHEQIPLTAAIGVRVAEYAGGVLTLTAPLEPNHNHLGTAFGGSLAALATLAGYCLLWLELQDHTAHIVVRECALSYLRPVTGELHATCRLPEADVWREFQQTWTRRQKARIRLEVSIEQDGETAVSFNGLFVAQK